MEKKQENKNKKLIIIGLLVTLLVLIIITGIAFARYVTNKNATATADVAKAICTMVVEPSEESIETVNPYCIVKVRNYDNDGNIAETDMNYKIEVEPKEDFELPVYYWEKDGTIVAHSTDLTGTIPLSDEFGKSVEEEDAFKIVFVNPGTENITRRVEFKLTATQKQP